MQIHFNIFLQLFYIYDETRQVFKQHNSGFDDIFFHKFNIDLAEAIFFVLDLWLTVSIANTIAKQVNENIFVIRMEFKNILFTGSNNPINFVVVNCRYGRAAERKCNLYT